MVDNFLGRGISNIPNQLKTQNVLIPTGFGTAATNQIENFLYIDKAGATYTLFYTVPAGKTFYVSTIVMTVTGGGDDAFLATGEAGSEVDFIRTGSATGLVIPMPVPMKFSSGTKISAKSNAGGSADITLIGWQE